MRSLRRRPKQGRPGSDVPAKNDIILFSTYDVMLHYVLS